MEALTQDEDLAREMLNRPAGKSAARRRMSEWSPEVELLSVAVDRLAELIQTVAAGNGAKPHPITPAPRPQTADERVRNSERMRKHRALVARVLPHKAHENSTEGGKRPSR